MARSEQLKKQTRRTVFSITVLVVITLALVGSSLAWFVTNKTVDVNSFTLTTDGAYNLQISPTEKDDWSYDLHMDDSMRLRPVVGNGTSFFTAKFTQQADEEGGSVFHSAVSGYESVSADNLGKYVLKADFKVTIEQDCPLLVEDLMLQMPRSDTEKNTNFETDPSGIDRSDLLGAVRLAILEKTGATSYTPCFYWVPDPESMLIETDGVYTLGTRSSDFESFCLQNKAQLGEETVVPAPAGGTGTVTTEDGLTVYFGGKLIRDTDYRQAQLIQRDLFPKGIVLTQLVGRQTKEFRLVVWLDGNDNECNNVLMGGTVQVGMRLSADIQEKE